MRSSRISLIPVLACAGLLAACTSTAKQSVNGPSGDVPAQVQALFRGTDTAPPATSPKPAPGKKVWIISCAEAAEGCAQASKDTAQAAASVGWQTTIYDGKFNANNAYSTGVRQAVAAGADGIVLDGVDCNDVKQAMQEAKAAGVKTVEAQDANDCTGTSLASAVVIANSADPTPDSWGVAWGKAKAQYLRWKLGNKGKILDVVYEGVQHALVTDTGFQQGIAACSACHVVKVPITLGDLSSGTFEGKVADALVKNPDVSAVVVPYDNLVQAGVAPALAHAGLNNVVVLGGEGLGSNLDLIRQGKGQTAVVAYDTGWLSWAAIDTMIRVFAGQPAVAEGSGFTAVDRAHNIPPSGPFVSKIDYQTAYKKAWSAS